MKTEKTKFIRNAAIAAIAVVVVAAVGYMAGMKSAGQRPKPTATYNGQTGAGQPLDYNELVGEYRAKLAENPNDWDLNARMGDIYFGMRRFGDAVAHYKKSIKLNPDDVDSYNDLGLSHHYLGNSAEGLRFVEEGIKRNPYYQRIWLTKGFILAYGLGRKDDAVKAWEKAVKIDATNDVGRDAYAFIEEFRKR
jgi:tetratricopeptide (TPR) repeat protein